MKDFIVGATAKLPTRWGDFQITTFLENATNQEHVVVSRGDVTVEPVLVRLHSECFTGDLLGSLRCDCGEQLQRSFELIAAASQGMILYLRQEGRGIGLTNKIKAYALQDQGLDTVEANLALGFCPDMRDYKVAVEILKYYGISKITLLTNNPEKEQQLSRYGIFVVGTAPLEIAPNKVNKKYLQVKKKKFGHRLTLS